jgi:hypothetical protein
MIAIHRDRTRTGWQELFLTILPEIQTKLRYAFRQFDIERQDELVAEAVVHCLRSFVNFHERGLEKSATACTLSKFAAMQVKSGRPAAGQMNRWEPLSRYAEATNRTKIKRVSTSWIDEAIEDKRASVVDLVIAKMDFRAWIETLDQRMVAIAQDLAFGYSTSEVGKKHRLSPARISQLRRELQSSWEAFLSKPRLAAPE